MGQICPGLRVVTQLRDVEQLSTEETARVLGLGVLAVKSRCRRVRLTMRELLTPYFGQSKSCETEALKLSAASRISGLAPSFSKGRGAK
jgi:hypothetical protein